MFKTRKMSVRRGIALGAVFGYLIGLMVLFSFTFDSALVVCSISVVGGIFIGLFVNFLYNLEYNKRL